MHTRERAETYLTSPECVLSFPRTSSSIPGLRSTLQNGTRTAACGSAGLYRFSEDTNAVWSASRITLQDRRVRGSVREMSGRDDPVEIAGATAVVANVRSMQRPADSTSLNSFSSRLEECNVSC